MRIKPLSATFRMSFGLVALVISMLLIAQLLGLVPDNQKAEIEARARVAESLAIQLTYQASQDNPVVLQDSLVAIAGRNTEIRSIALRRADGDIVVSTGDHEELWKGAADGQSTPEYVQISLRDGNAVWGQIEIVFTPLPSASVFLGIPVGLFGLLGFLGASGFVGFYLILRRVLKEIDPSQVVPERVQTAFDTLAEGILIIDNRGAIMLANDAFARLVQRSPDQLVGSPISGLNWRSWTEKNDQKHDFPWESCLKTGQQIAGARIGLRTANGGFQSLLVNATCISDEKGRVSGIIVTFDDVTALERKNDRLVIVNRKLQDSEKEISKQNQELKFLANHDPLSGCLNRRAFFEGFERALDSAVAARAPLTCLMVDVDFFKKVNDTYGHATGDVVIAGVAGVLRSIAPQSALVGRYGGEEFCIVVSGIDADQSIELAESLRKTIHAESINWLQNGNRITVSIGLAQRPANACTTMDCVNWADESLYEAKESGRNRVVVWNHADSTLKTSECAEGSVPGDSAPALVGTPAAPNPVASQAVLSLVASNDANKLTSTPKPTLQPGAQSGPPESSRFLDELEQAIARVNIENRRFALVHIASNALERVITAFGEDAGRAFLTSLNERLSAALGDYNPVTASSHALPDLSLLHVCDEAFLVKILDFGDTGTVTQIVEHLFAQLDKPFEVDGQQVYVQANAGTSLYPDDGSDAQTLFHNAEIAFRQAAQDTGTSNHRFFSETTSEHARRQMALEAHLRQAVEHRLFELHYQPIINLRTGRLETVEALLRCTHPELAGSRTDVIIAVAEQTGLIVDIGDWVVRQAVAEAEHWQAYGYKVPLVSINLSAVQISDPSAMDALMQVLMEMPLPSSKVQFEITETAIMSDEDAASIALMRLQQMGAIIALDDFGTGQSSLSYLRRFHPDVIKIDRSFVRDILTNGADEMLVSAIVEVSHQVNIHVVVEGIETEAQLTKVQEIGCDSVQGYLFARPMPAAQLLDWLTTNVHRQVA